MFSGVQRKLRRAHAPSQHPHILPSTHPHRQVKREPQNKVGSRPDPYLPLPSPSSHHLTTANCLETPRAIPVVPFVLLSVPTGSPGPPGHPHSLDSSLIWLSGWRGHPTPGAPFPPFSHGSQPHMKFSTFYSLMCPLAASHNRKVRSRRTGMSLPNPRYLEGD